MQPVRYMEVPTEKTVCDKPDSKRQSVTCIGVKTIVTGFLSNCLARIITAVSGNENRRVKLRDWVFVEMEDVAVQHVQTSQPGTRDGPMFELELVDDIIDEEGEW